MSDNVAVIGAGVIGGAIVRSLLRSDSAGKITATRRSIQRLHDLENLGATTTTDNRKAARDSDIIFICVKPNDVKKVLKEITTEIEQKLYPYILTEN